MEDRFEPMVRGQRKGNGQRHCSLLIVACSLLIVNLFAACSIEGDVQSVRDRVREENKAFTVTFNSNSGAPAPAPQSVAPGGRASEPAAMARTGYTFGAWYKEADFINQWNFADNTVSGDITLHAKWNPITYTVAYNRNQPGATGTMESSVHTYDAAKNLSSNTFAYGNNVFMGWNTLPDGQGASYSNGQSVLNLADTAGATVTLYAVWADYSTVWTVRFETSGGSAVGDINILKNTRVDRPEPDPARAGYTFANWYSNPELNEPPYNFNSLVINNITLHAKWNPIAYTIAYDKNADDAAGATASSSHVYDVDKELSANGFTRVSYTFAGWARTGDGAVEFTDSESVKNLTEAAGATVTLYAQWTPITNVPGATLAAKLSWLQANAVSDVDYTVEVNADENIAPHTLSYSGRSNIGITLTGTGAERVIGLLSTGSLFTVEDGVTLVLGDNITLQGRSDNIASLVTVNEGGTLLMNTGSRITGNNTSNSSTMSGGVWVVGTFTMSGGEISGNIGRLASGVVVSNGTFTMSGGEISDNTTNGDGGGVYVHGGTFTMHDGEISGNTARISGGGVFVYGGTFTMNGDAKISGNTSVMNGGGVYVGGSATFTMNGGEISGNTAAYGGGGGVYVLETFIKTGNSTITGYVSDEVNGNVVKNNSGEVQSNLGHAVCVSVGNYPNFTYKRRESTAGPNVDLWVDTSTDPPTFGGEWED